MPARADRAVEPGDFHHAALMGDEAADMARARA
jgi:hypothetical protein